MSVFVFLGPSLDTTTASAILPNAYYLPPVACGDIVRIMNLQPTTIVIIDGYFENQPAVWHKEILYALSQGVIVYGAASMGALRSAELDDFGMIGVGEVYRRYKVGDIVDDDEVALLHMSKDENFKPCSLPMINLRFTIEEALLSGIINSLFAKEFLSIAKQLFYHERTDVTLKIKCKHLVGIDSFFAWFENNYIDQKMQDAKDVLFTVKNNVSCQKIANINKHDFASTALFRNLKIDNMSMPYNFFYDWLPLNHKINVMAKLFNEYSLSKQLAKAIGIAHDCGFIAISNQIISFIKPLSNPELIEEVYSYFIKLSKVEHLNEIEQYSLKLLAQIVAHVYRELKPLFTTIDAHSIAETTKQVYRSNNIDNQEKFIVWLQKNNMEIGEFKNAMQLLHFTDYFITKNNLVMLFESQVTKMHDYFSIAISLNGLDKKIVDTFKIQKEPLLKNNMANLTVKGDLYAILHDFNDSFAMRKFIDKVAYLDTDWLSGFSLTPWNISQIYC